MTRRATRHGKKGAGFSAAVLAVISAVVAIEGGYVDHPSDPGGATNFGITEAVARQHGYSGDMRDLTENEARQIYAQSYVRAPGFEPIVNDAKPAGKELVDGGVNYGTARAGRFFQIALNTFNRRGRDYPDITVDGAVGAKTIAAWEMLKRRRGRKVACELIVKAIDVQQGAHYMRLARNNSKFEDFAVGWFKRVHDVAPEECS